MDFKIGPDNNLMFLQQSSMIQSSSLVSEKQQVIDLLKGILTPLESKFPTPAFEDNPKGYYLNHANAMGSCLLKNKDLLENFMKNFNSGIQPYFNFFNLAGDHQRLEPLLCICLILHELEHPIQYIFAKVFALSVNDITSMTAEQQFEQIKIIEDKLKQWATQTHFIKDRDPVCNFKLFENLHYLLIDAEDDLNGTALDFYKKLEQEFQNHYNVLYPKFIAKSGR